MNKQPRNKGGRPKGSPNKATAEARELFVKLMDSLLPEVEGWIRAEAEQNREPGRAADLFFKLSEFCVPKLGRVEHEHEHRFEQMSDEQLESRFRELTAKAAESAAESKH